ncbi:hypothetical protein ASPACDRAFT_1904258 [Aspergillus aculeatus ATCC 16872]|uniref:FAD-binding domain-containing protein n=1 Tax=Aspergillus aculeatus (strain ATCC 16872 / CBS 172.66 / WB 5094) TaxID=690307 RepID=A0A1L9WMT3_ASPA1|nr:uncharacterized protein ASPACDRAFT_1904258 [Aspergillus aculeatus ATCC 16872]OJJ97479.1 hypothetical protein ASPACDRAFT_1904258 [Aspergillus aculeatus ATCC 16872]
MDLKPKVVVVGAGPVGSLAALYAASRGYQVEVYDLRPNPCLSTNSDPQPRASVSLALSERGLHAIKTLNRAGLMETVLDCTIPLYGRMIHGHSRTGKPWESSQAYDVLGRFIYSTDRQRLSQVLNRELASVPNISVFFNSKLMRVDFDKNRAYFERVPGPGFTQTEEPSASPHEVRFDFMIGADGIHSKTRQQLMRYTRMSYQQVYEDLLWCEFRMPATSTGHYRLSPQHLHLWSPRASEDGSHRRLMFVAFPSSDGSFNCSLFAPSACFARLSQCPDDGSVPAFFDRHFPGISGTLIAPASLQAQFAAHPHVPLMDIKCSHLHYGASVVIVGDAAHAVLPFYGQGLNAGLEDVRLLFETLDRHAGARAPAFAAYSAARLHDLHAIYDLSRGNYHELQEGVRSPFYRLRKAIEEALCKYLPALGWATQYARVSFTNEPYSQIVKSSHHQKRILLAGCLLVVVVYLAWVSFFVLLYARGMV